MDLFLLNRSDHIFLLAGLVIYFGYGIRCSVQRKRLKADKEIETISNKTDIIKEEKF